MTFRKLGKREAENREWGKFSKAAPFQESESGEREREWMRATSENNEHL